MDWYYLKGKEKVGPILGQQFAALAREGQIGPNTPVWRQGLSGWQPAAQAAAALFAAPSSGAPRAPQVSTLGMDDPISGLGLSAFGMDTDFTCCSCGKTYSKDLLMKFEEHDVCRTCHVQFAERKKRGLPIFYDEYVKLVRKRQRIRMTRWIGAVIVGLIGVAAVVLGHANHAGAAKALRIVASTGVVAVAISGGAHKSRYGLSMLGAFGVFWFADLLLGVPEAKIPMASVVALSLASIVLVVAFFLRGVAIEWLIVMFGIFVLVIGGVLSWLYPPAPAEAHVPLVVSVILASAIPIVGGGTRGAGASLFIVFGAVCLYVFAVFVARASFVTPGFLNAALGLPLYYAGVLLLAVSIPEERKDETEMEPSPQRS